MRRSLLAFLVSFSLVLAAAGAQTQFNGTTVAYANETVANAAYYIQQVNESSYLIFYPNLTKAYADLFKAESVYNTSPSVAVVYANKAATEASHEYARISAYRDESFAAMAAVTVLFVVLLSLVSRRVDRHRKK